MADDRARYFRRLRRLRAAARRWSVLAGGFTGATLILVPYRGLGLPDAIWAGLAGGSAVLAGWRWSDVREQRALPPPPPPDPRQSALRARQRVESVIAQLPAGQLALDGARRAQSRLRLRGTAVAGVWERLDRSAQTLVGLAGRLHGPAEAAVLEAAVAERELRDLAERVLAVERAVRVAPADSRAQLAEAHQALIGQLSEGVTAYERLVAAAAGYVAEDGRSASEHPAVGQLTEAAERLRGVTAGLTELRHLRDPARPSGS